MHDLTSIARYKQPREIRFVTALPRSAIGKVKKQELRDALARPVTA
jgi:non-ribosomal peptide synthetase component E (peptide arylation enzyme)